MKILLLQPPVEDFYCTDIRTEPIGLCYLAAVLRQKGHSVSILDCVAGKKREIPFPQQFAYLKKYYVSGDLSPFSLFKRYYHYGLVSDEIETAVKKSDADVFCVSASFTAYSDQAAAVVECIKKVFPSRPVIMGGAYISAAAKELLCLINADFFIRGEGEEILPVLIDAIVSGNVQCFSQIPGLIYREKETLLEVNAQHNKSDPEKLPFPSRSLLNREEYRIGKKRSTMLVTSRGCPYSCRFCNVRSVFGNKFRARSVNNVLTEIQKCYEQFTIVHFDIEDDCFLLDKKRAKAILKGITDFYPKRTVRLSVMNGVVWGHLDEELLSLMYDAGFDEINLSLVSSSALDRSSLMRPPAQFSFETIIKKIRAAKLRVVAYTILGLPGSTVSSILNDIIYLAQLPVLLGPSMFYPVLGLDESMRYPGEVTREKNLFYRSSACSMVPNGMSRDELMTLFRLSRMINFIKEVIDTLQPDASTTLTELIDKTQQQYKNIYNNDTEFLCETKKTLTRFDYGILQLERLLKHGKLMGIRKLPGKTCQYAFFDYENQTDVIGEFLEKVQNKQLLGHRCDCVVLWR